MQVHVAELTLQARSSPSLFIFRTALARELRSVWWSSSGWKPFAVWGTLWLAKVTTCQGRGWQRLPLQQEGDHPWREAHVLAQGSHVEPGLRAMFDRAGLRRLHRVLGLLERMTTHCLV